MIVLIILLFFCKRYRVWLGKKPVVRVTGETKKKLMPSYHLLSDVNLGDVDSNEASRHNLMLGQLQTMNAEDVFFTGGYVSVSNVAFLSGDSEQRGVLVAASEEGHLEMSSQTVLTNWPYADSGPGNSGFGNSNFYTRRPELKSVAFDGEMSSLLRLPSIDDLTPPEFDVSEIMLRSNNLSEIGDTLQLSSRARRSATFDSVINPIFGNTLSNLIYEPTDLSILDNITIKDMFSFPISNTHLADHEPVWLSSGNLSSTVDADHLGPIRVPAQWNNPFLNPASGGNVIPSMVLLESFYLPDNRLCEWPTESVVPTIDALSDLGASLNGRVSSLKSTLLGHIQRLNTSGERTLATKTLSGYALYTKTTLESIGVYSNLKLPRVAYTGDYNQLKGVPTTTSFFNNDIYAMSTESCLGGSDALDGEKAQSNLQLGNMCQQSVSSVDIRGGVADYNYVYISDLVVRPEDHVSVTSRMLGRVAPDADPRLVGWVPVTRATENVFGSVLIGRDYRVDSRTSALSGSALVDMKTELERLCTSVEDRLTRLEAAI